MADSKPQIIVHTVVNVASAEAQYNAAARYIRDHLMSCRNCGHTMERGTQCPRCKAWCR